MRNPSKPLARLLILLTPGVTLLSVTAAPVIDGGLSGVWPEGIEATRTLDVLEFSTGTFGAAGGSNVNDLGTFGNAGLNMASAIGTLRNGGDPDFQIDFGGGATADTLRGTVRMSISGGLSLVNVTGDDVWVTEGGGANAPEAYMMRVSTNNGATWSNWEYRFSQVQYNPGADAGIAFFTGFDFVNDFGLAPTAVVTTLELQNAIAADTVSGAAGEGSVILGGGSGFALNKGPQGAGAGYSSGTYDADLGYVFYAQSVPEPSTAILLGFGAALLQRRKRARESFATDR